LNSGKNAYHAFHVAIGTLDAPAFERLTPREQEAWRAVAGDDGAEFYRLQNRIDELQRELSLLKALLKEQPAAKPKPKIKRVQ
jgi:hypothetical protein